MASAGLTVLSQMNFFAGASPGMELIADGSRRYHYSAGAEDIVNGLMNDDGAVYRRGGTVSAGVRAAAMQPSAWAGFLPGGQFLIVGDAVYNGGGSASASETPLPGVAFSPVTGTYAFGGTPGAQAPKIMVTEVTSTAIIAAAAPASSAAAVFLYAGATSAGAPRSMTYTGGSATVTTADTSGLTPGQFLFITGVLVGAIATIDSGTQITMVGSYGGGSGTSTTSFSVTSSADLHVNQPQILAANFDAIGTAAERLFVAQRNRIHFSVRNSPLQFAKDDYHELPQGGRVLGLAGLGTTMLVFSTQGAWAIGNVELALTDPAGNVQQSLQQVDPEFALWDQRGIASWQGRLVVPGTQDVMLFTSGGSAQPVTGGIAALYRSYVKAGYQLGSATVYRGHYLLPVLTGNTVVDVLVCRLEASAWSRWAGQAACSAFVHTYGDASAARTPKLYGVNGASVLDCSGCFDQVPANTADADGSQHALTLVGRTRTLSPTGTHTWRNVRIPYDITGTGSFTLETAVGAPGSGFRLEAGTPDTPATDTSKTWWFARQGKSFRYRLTSTGAPSSLVIRGDEVGVRPHQQV
jgi:hypothetical protein